MNDHRQRPDAECNKEPSGRAARKAVGRKGRSGAGGAGGAAGPSAHGHGHLGICVPVRARDSGSCGFA